MQTTHPAGNDLRSVVFAAAALRGIYTESRLAEATGIGRGTMQDWWKDAGPSRDSIARLARTLDLSESLLLRVAGGERPLLRIAEDEPDATGERLDAMQRQIADLEARMTGQLEGWTSRSPRPLPRPPRPAGR